MHIVVPVYNEPRLVIRCLRSLRASMDDPRVVLVDDGSAQAARAQIDAYLEAEFPAAEVVTHDRNRGFKEAIHSGLAAVHGDHVILLNTDTVVTPGFATRLLGALRQDRAIAAAAPVSNHPTDLYQYRPEFHLPPELDGPALFQRMAQVAVLTQPRGSRRLRDAPFLTGMCLALDRAAFEEAGGFGTAYEHGYFEDLALSCRFRQMGRRLVICEDCFVFHQGHASYRRKPSDEKIAIIQHNFRQFTREWSAEPAYDDLLRRMERAGQAYPV